jgi:hypothetical protein
VLNWTVKVAKNFDSVYTDITERPVGLTGCVNMSNSSCIQSPEVYFSYQGCAS